MEGIVKKKIKLFLDTSTKLNSYAVKKSILSFVVSPALVDGG
jgi:hypothetical protein